MADNVDVLVAGAGPTGLALALWLTRLGVKVRIVDKSPRQVETSRALATHARTLEFYDQIGIANDFLKEGVRFEAIRLWARGAQRARAILGEAGKGISPFPYFLIISQDEHERILIKHLEAAGVTVERPLELTAVEQSADGVRARLTHADGAEETAEASYMAGCDGARSKVREAVGAGFPGGTYSRLFYVADVEATGPVMNGDLNLAMDAADFLAVFPLKGPNRARLVGDIEHAHSDALAFDDVGQNVIQRLGIEIKTVNWFSSYRVHHRVADPWRAGRIFLLGDAAHIHSPVGGQGMNTGIGDAVNLAWKLAVVVKGDAADMLLDTYQGERIAFARRLVATTDRAFQLISRDDWIARFMRLELIPAILPILFRWRAVRRLMFLTISQTNINYRGLGLAEGRAGSVRGGDRLPWVEGTDNFEPLRKLAWHAQAHGEPDAGAAEACARAGLDFVRFPWTQAADRVGIRRGAIHVVRPDGYVAAVTEGGAEDVLAGLQERFALKF